MIARAEAKLISPIIGIETPVEQTNYSEQLHFQWRRWLLATRAG